MPKPRQTLRRQLVIRITLIVTAISVALAGISTFVVGRILTDSVDQQIAYAVHATENRPHGPNDDDLSVPDSGVVELRTGGLPTGSIATITTPSGTTMGTIIRFNGPAAASLDQMEALADLTVDGRVRTIEVPDLGSYRAAAIEKNGTVLAVAVPMTATQQMLEMLMWVEGALIIVAAGSAAGISTLVVRNSLRRLNKLVDTATEVSQLELETGEVAIDARVDLTHVAPESEVGRVGTAFNAMLDHVESSLQARQASEQRVRQFVADASHELRNPLASIRGYAELTRRGRDELPPDTVFALGRIDAESQRMSHLVEEMLLLARLDNGVGLDRQPLDLAESVLNAVSDARAASPGHHWRLHVPSVPVTVNADRAQLQQVLMNVLGNARKHTPEGTTVHTTLQVDGPVARITIADDGPGIDPELAAHIFERFTRGDASRMHDGEGSTGLGMAIAHAVVKEHGGTIRVDNVEPHGTMFTITLPLSS